MSLPDPNDPSISDLLNLYYPDLLDEANIRFDGSQLVHPVMHVVHKGRADGFDLFAATLQLDINGAGTGARGLVILGEQTQGDLILVDNDDLSRYALRLTPEGRLGISTLRTISPQARLEVAQADTGVIGLIVFAKGGTGEDLFQAVNNSGVKTLWVTVSGELHTIKDAFFVGTKGIQVGSQTMDIPAFSGPSIGLTNLTTTAFTGTSTNGIAIVATDGRLRYVDPDGTVWRLPNGNPISEVHDLKAWNFDAVQAVSDAEFSSGTLYLVKTLFHRSVQSSTIKFYVTNGNGSAANVYAGIYDLAGNRLTQTADLSAMVATTGLKSAAMISPPTMPPVYYYLAFLCGSASGQAPRLSCAGAPEGVGNVNLSAPNFRFAKYSTGLTALPSTITMASMTSSPKQLWMGIA